MYNLISILSIIIRQFLLPNPFASLPNGELYNLLASIILYPITYLIVGLYYEKGSAPALGSFLYLLFYMVHTGLIALCGYFYFSKMACIVISAVYVAILIVVKLYRNRLY